MPTLQYVQPTQRQIDEMQEFRDLLENVYKKVETLRVGRGRSIALTKLEEASMWINKSITHND